MKKLLLKSKGMTAANPKLTIPKFKKAFKRAFDEWNTIVLNKFEMKFVKTPEEANVTFQFFINHSALMGYIKPTNREGKLVNKVEIYISGSYDWFYKPKDFETNGKSVNIYNLFLHELGHVFGLAHSTLETSDMPTMNKFITGTTALLSQDDRDGIRSVYSGNRSLRSVLNRSCKCLCEQH